jgi:hypothetical protein
LRIDDRRVSLFEIHRKFMPERSRLGSSLFESGCLREDNGFEVIEDLVSLLTSSWEKFRVRQWQNRREVKAESSNCPTITDPDQRGCRRI